MKIELLVDSQEFWNRLEVDLAEATKSAYLQTFSFEGDRVGVRLARRLAASPAADRRLLVDGYSLLYHNDRMVPGPAWLERSFRREVLLTHRLGRKLRERGVGVRFCNPIGPSPLKTLRRNHKKLAVFDDRVAYLGGINFCEHNFAWHDMMIRVEDPHLSAALAHDFRGSWGGQPAAWDRTFGPFRILSMNGRGNPARFRPVVEAIQGARTSIDVVSAYLSTPFTKYLSAAGRRGVQVRVLTPEENNKGNLARHVIESATRNHFEIIRYPGRMNHLKAMVVDDELLIAGSSNFDFMSFHVLEELVFLTRDADLLSDFKRRVWEPDTRNAGAFCPRSSTGTRAGHRAIRAAASLAGFLALS
jgi:cardiolipin synthase